MQYKLDMQIGVEQLVGRREKYCNLVDKMMVVGVQKMAAVGHKHLEDGKKEMRWMQLEEKRKELREERTELGMEAAKKERRRGKLRLLMLED